tara:strand:- start:880 stop:1062 length:183 start_codon:yes stop_codon:yes gene_type:complete
MLANFLKNFTKEAKKPLHFRYSLQKLEHNQKNKISLQNTHYINYYNTSAYRQYRPNWAKK